MKKKIIIVLSAIIIIEIIGIGYLFKDFIFKGDDMGLKVEKFDETIESSDDFSGLFEQEDKESDEPVDSKINNNKKDEVEKSTLSKEEEKIENSALSNEKEEPSDEEEEWGNIF